MDKNDGVVKAYQVFGVSEKKYESIVKEMDKMIKDPQPKSWDGQMQELIKKLKIKTPEDFYAFGFVSGRAYQVIADKINHLEKIHDLMEKIRKETA